MDDPEIDDLIAPICELADAEKNEGDPEWNALVEAAARIRDREGFFVTDGSELERPDGTHDPE